MTVNEKSEKNNKYFRSGNYSAFITVIVLAIAIIINSIVGMLPDKYTKFDMTATDVFTLTDTTKEILAELDKEITIYTIAEIGNENEYVENYVGIYKSENSHIKSEQINPITDPQFLEDYGVNLSQGSLVIECGDKHDSIEISDMFIETIDSATSESSLTGIDIEGLLTSAIVRLTADVTPKAYEVYGQSEYVLTDEQKSSIKKQNIDIDHFDYTLTGIPEDADILIINSPKVDYTDEQTEEILDFMKSGKAALIIMPTNGIEKAKRLQNVDRILAYYGAELEYGTVLESKSDYYLEEDNYYTIVGQLQSHNITNSLLTNNTTTAFIAADSIKLLNDVEDIKIEVIVKSSASAYFKEQKSSVMSQLATDKSGTFNYGIAFTDQSSATGNKMVLYSSAALVNAAMDSKVNGANTQLLVSSLRWLAGQDEDVMIAVKGLYPANLVLTQKQISVNTIILAVMIPVFVLGYGLIVWIRRRRR